jgi:hypothetical protein
MEFPINAIADAVARDDPLPPLNLFTDGAGNTRALFGGKS